MNQIDDDKTIICSCRASFQNKLQHLASGLALLLLRIVILSLALAYLMSLREALQRYGVGAPNWPFSHFGQYHPRISLENSTSPLVASVDQFLVMLNTSIFPGDSRLGSGVGLIAACFWTLHTVPPKCRIQRFGIGIVAGALIGFRLRFMLSSSAEEVLFSSAMFAVGITAYMMLADRKPGIPPLPAAPQENC